MDVETLSGTCVPGDRFSVDLRTGQYSIIHKQQNSTMETLLKIPSLSLEYILHCYSCKGEEPDSKLEPRLHKRPTWVVSWVIMYLCPGKEISMYVSYYLCRSKSSMTFSSTGHTRHWRILYLNHVLCSLWQLQISRRLINETLWLLLNFLSLSSFLKNSL